MPAFRFIGDSRTRESGENPSNPEMIEAFGVLFALNGDPEEVSDERAVIKLRGNAHFAEVKPRRGRPRKAEDDGEDAS